MRLWTVHPRYLDTKGLLAVWREGLLAQKVLLNQTMGYRNHPQLKRFTASSDPVAAIGSYLQEIQREAVQRGFQFNENKIIRAAFPEQILCTRGQLLYEWQHLQKKLKLRDTKQYQEMGHVSEPEPHPLFQIIEGDVEEWEVHA